MKETGGVLPLLYGMIEREEHQRERKGREPWMDMK